MQGAANNGFWLYNGDPLPLSICRPLRSQTSALSAQRRLSNLASQSSCIYRLPQYVVVALFFSFYSVLTVSLVIAPRLCPCLSPSTSPTPFLRLRYVLFLGLTVAPRSRSVRPLLPLPPPYRLFLLTSLPLAVGYWLESTTPLPQFRRPLRTRLSRPACSLSTSSMRARGWHRS